MSRPEDISSQEELARALTDLQLDAGLTLHQVAEASGVPTTTIHDWFSGKRLPPSTRRKAFERVLRACGVTDSQEIERWWAAVGRLRAWRKKAAGEVENPFPGLARFEIEHHQRFCGRRALTADLLKMVGERRVTGGPVAVVGASGSGKSSLLRAGLLAALRRDALDGSAGWSVRVFTPRSDPLRELVLHLVGQAHPDLDAVVTSLRSEPASVGGLVAHVATVGVDDQAGRLVLVVDQMEELFATNIAEADRAAFIAALDAAAAVRPSAAGPPPALVVLGLRADFYGHALRYPTLARVLRDSQIVVGPMTAEELKEAIGGPVRAVGGRLSDELIELILREVRPRDDAAAITDISHTGHEDGALPLLSHALRVAWEADRPNNRVTATSYRKVGGVDGAIAQTAEARYQHLESDDQRDLARLLFLRLVRLGTDSPDTRRRRVYEELVDVADPGRTDVIADVLETFIQDRLITVRGRDEVEITHEAVLRAWPRLREWLSTDRVGLLERTRLADAAVAWRDTAVRREGCGGAPLVRDPDILFRGGALDRALAWQNDNPGELSSVEEEFLAAARARRDEEERTERERLAAELQAEHDRLQAERGRVRLLRRLGVVAVVAAVLLAALAVFAWVQQRAAVEQRDVAESREVAASALRLLNSDPALAAQLGLAAYRLAPTPEARSALLDTFSGPSSTRVLSPTGLPQTVAFTQDGSLMATGGADSADTGIRMWSLADRQHPRLLTPQPLTGHTGPVYGLAFSPDGHTLVSSGADATIRVWDVTDPTRAKALGGPVEGPQGTVYSVAFSLDGHVLAVAGADRTVRLFDATDPGDLRAVATLPMAASPVQTVTFHPTLPILAEGSKDGAIQLWDLANPETPRLLGTPQTGLGAVLHLTFSADGRTLAAGGAQKTVRLWDVSDPAAMKPMGDPLTGPAGLITFIAFAPDGATVAAASADNKVWVWNLATRQVQAALPHPAVATMVRFLDHDGATLATSAADGATRIWTLPGPVITEPTDIVFTAKISTDGRTLLLGWDGDATKDPTDQRVRLYDISDPRHPVPQSPPLTASTGRGLSGAAALSPDRRLLAAGSLDGAVFLWNVADPARPSPLGTPLASGSDNIESVEFTPDGATIVVAGDDGRVRLWDVTDTHHSRLTATLTEPKGAVYATAVSQHGLLAAASADKTVWLWDITNRDHPLLLGPALTGPSKEVYSVAFGSDEHTLAAGSADKTVRLWDITDPHQPTPIGSPFIGPNNTVFWLTFSPNTQYLAAGGGDGTVWMWDLTNRTHPSTYATLTALTDPVWSVSFDPRGTVLAAGGAARAGRLWSTDPAQAATYICTTSGDPITPDEWEKYVPDQDYAPPCR